DLLLAAVAVGVVGAALVDFARGGAIRAAGRTVLRLVVAASLAYLLFLVTWGLNYRRVPLAEKLRSESGNVSAEGARRLGLAAVERLNALHGLAHAAPPRGDPRDGPLASSFARVQRQLGATVLAVPARPKRTWADLYFKRAAVDAM